MITLLQTDARCRPVKTNCSIKETCARYQAAIPHGGTCADFSAGPVGCVGKYVPAPRVGGPVVRSVHDHPGGAL